MPRAALDLVPLAALLALLVTAYVHPRARTELGIGCSPPRRPSRPGSWVAPRSRRSCASSARWSSSWSRSSWSPTSARGPACSPPRPSGVRAASGGAPVRMFTGVFLLAAAVTAVLSLDATVVLLTPVVVVATAAARTSAAPGSHACLRMANSASLLLPVSNLTNLLAMPHLSLTFGAFALTMAPVLLAVLVVSTPSCACCSAASWPRPRPWADPGTRAGRSPAAARAGPLAVVAAMLVGFAVGSPFGVEPCWISGVAALVLVLWARHRGLVSWRQAGHAAHPAFAVFVLCLGVVVEALSVGFLGDLVADLVPGGTSHLDLLAIAVLATVLANLLTNLSATLPWSRCSPR